MANSFRNDLLSILPEEYGYTLTKFSDVPNELSIHLMTDYKMSVNDSVLLKSDNDKYSVILPNDGTSDNYTVLSFDPNTDLVKSVTADLSKNKYAVSLSSLNFYSETTNGELSATESTEVAPEETHSCERCKILEARITELEGTINEIYSLIKPPTESDGITKKGKLSNYGSILKAMSQVDMGGELQ